MYSMTLGFFKGSCDSSKASEMQVLNDLGILKNNLVTF